MVEYTVNSLLWKKRQSRYTCLEGSGPRLNHRSWKSRNTSHISADKCHLGNTEDPAVEVQKTAPHKIENIAFKAKDIKN